MKMRSEVRKFALLMEAKLKANDCRTHWSHESLQFLSMRLTQERKELQQAIRSGVVKDIANECADVANFCMMITDKIGGLK